MRVSRVALSRGTGSRTAIGVCVLFFAASGLDCDGPNAASSSSARGADTAPSSGFRGTPVPPPAASSAAVLTAARDTTVLPAGFADRNFGASPVLQINQALIAFDPAELASAVAGNLELGVATLEVTVTRGPPRTFARSIEAFRLTHDWSELAATWDCAADSRPSDARDNCPRGQSWNMGPAFPPNPWATPATASAPISGSTSTLSFDVTADVRAFLDGSKPNFGWILKARGLDDDLTILLGARESGHPPRLRIGTRCRSAFADCDHDPANGCEQSLGTVDACGACGVSCDDHNPCTADSCGANGCQHDPVGDGAGCDDGDACSSGDVCRAGVCTGVAVVCGGGDACHAAGVCDPATGTCASPPLVDGTSCTDGDACTQGDTCQAGLCQAGAAVVCAGGDQCHGAGVCDPASGACVNAPLVDGTPCTDGDACTQGDACRAGLCGAGAAVVCAGGDQCHGAGVCDPASGACVNAPLVDGTPCTDGDACTSADRCVAGACQAGAPVACAGSDGCHPGVCDRQTGACSTVAACQLYGTGAIPGTALDGLAVTPGRLEDGVSNNQIGGIGSAIAYTGVGNLFVATPDRGPNAGADSFTERYYLIDVALESGQVTPIVRGASVLDKGAGLDSFTGLDTAFDATNSPASRRLDCEGVRVGPQGTFFVSDEYGPFLYEFGADGHRRRALAVPDKFLIDHPGIEDAELPPANTKGRQDNRGMEGLAISPDGSKLYGIMQSPLIQDGALTASNDRVGVNIRILEIDTTSGATRELVYQLDNPALGVNEMVAINDHQFLVIERDGKGGTSAAVKHLDLVDITGATDVSSVAALPSTGLPGGVTAVKKSLFLDLLDPAFALAGAAFPEKIEGLAFGPDLPDGRHVLLVTSDNDFISTQASQIFAFAIDPRALPGFAPGSSTFTAACADSTPASCPASGVCQRAGTCYPGDGSCSHPFTAAGTPAGTQAAGDCNQNQCDGAGGVQSAIDNTDVADDGNPCTAEACAAGLASSTPVAAGTSCSADGSSVCDGAGACIACTTGSCPGPAAPPSFRVVRVGDGTAALSSAATAVFIEERALDGTLVGTVALPIAAAGANLPFANSGSATSEGSLALSADGHTLALAGYAAVPGTAAVTGSASATVNRVVARVDALGNVDTSTALAAAFDANNVRGAASADGTGFWVAGAGGKTGGVWFVLLGARAGVQVAANPASVRWPLIFGGQLFASASSGAFVNVFTVGTGLPQIAGQTNVSLPGMPTTGSSSPYAYALFDLDPTVAGNDTLYVADDRAAASGGGVQKWSLANGTWTLGPTFNVAVTPNGFRGLAGTLLGGRPTLVATSADAVPRLVTFVDDGSAAVTGTVVATSPANTAFRGVAASPR